MHARFLVQFMSEKTDIYRKIEMSLFYDVTNAKHTKNAACKRPFLLLNIGP